MNKETGQPAETSLQASFSPACLHYYRCTIGVCVYLCTCSPEARWPRSRSGAVWSGPDMCASAPVNLPPVQIDIKSLHPLWDGERDAGRVMLLYKTSWKDRRMERWKQGWREGKRGSERCEQRLIYWMWQMEVILIFHICWYDQLRLLSMLHLLYAFLSSFF